MATIKSSKVLTVENYFASHPPKTRALLKQMRQTILKTAPGAEEVISYQMPAFKFHGMLVWYAAYKNHIGLYPFAKTLEVFKDKLKSYEQSKGTVRFPLDKPLPLKLLAEIVKYRMKENLLKESLKKTRGTSKRSK